MLDGTPVNTSLISGLFGSGGIAVSGSNLFVLVRDTIRGYTTDGQSVNAALITGLDSPFALEVSGSDLFVSTGFNAIAKYTTSGTLVNPSLITGLASPTSIAVNGTNLFVTNYESGTIGHYTTAGETVNASLVSGLDFPLDIGVSGSHLFVLSNGSDTIGEYATSGAAVNASLVTGLNESTRGIAVVPEPSAWIWLIVGAGFLMPVRGRHRMRAAEPAKRGMLVIGGISFLLSFTGPERARAQAIRTDAAFRSTTANMVRSGYTLYENGGPYDDGSASVPLGFPINFLGVSRSTIFVNNNGNITFTNALPDFTPDPNPFTVNNHVGAIIGPFFADVDTRPALNDDDPRTRLVTYGTSTGGWAYGIWDKLAGCRIFRSKYGFAQLFPVSDYQPL